LVLIIVAVGVLNVCLGFAAAWYLGYGPPGLREAWKALAPIPRPAEMPGPPASAASAAVPAAEGSPAQAAGSVEGSEPSAAAPAEAPAASDVPPAAISDGVPAAGDLLATPPAASQ